MKRNEPLWLKEGECRTLWLNEAECRTLDCRRKVETGAASLQTLACKAIDMSQLCRCIRRGDSVTSITIDLYVLYLLDTKQPSRFVNLLAPGLQHAHSSQHPDMLYALAKSSLLLSKLYREEVRAISNLVVQFEKEVCGSSRATNLNSVIETRTRDLVE